MPDKSQTSLQEHAITAAITNTFMQPFRTWLNYAPRFNNPFETIWYAFPNLFRGMPINVLRGTTMLCSQTWTQAKVHERYDKNTTHGKVLGILGAASVGTVVSTSIETWFIRRNAKLPGTLFSVPLIGFYAMRELGFSLVVLGSEGFTDQQKQAAMVGSTAITGYCHKQAVIAATKDGANTTIVNKALFESPKKHWQKIANGLTPYAYGGNMFLWRGVYLEAYKRFYKEVREQATPAVISSLRGTRA